MITPHGPVSVGEIDDDSITNAKINSSAAIAGSKLDPDMTNGVIGVAAGYKIAMGQMSTTSGGAGVDTVATGLATVVAAVAVFDDDPSADPTWVSCSIGNQAGAPDAGSIYIKTWQPTAANGTSANVTPKAATTFTKKVNWIAIGTAAA